MAIHKRFSLLLWPATFSEKNMLRIGKDRRNLLRICADKVAMRRYVAQKIGDRFLPKVFCIADDPANINWQELPERFVIKASHGSAFVSVVHQFNPAAIDRIESMVETCRAWLDVDYGKCNPEWGYTGIPRRILIEEFIESNYRGDDDVPWDFKFFVFDGRCAMVQVDTGRFASHRRNLYSTSWQLLESTYGYPPTETPLEKPGNLDELIELAERVGAGIDFVRVDLYAANSGPVVGELTMSPEGGDVHFSNARLDLFLGEQWKMTRFRD